MEDFRFNVNRERLMRSDGTDTEYDALYRDDGSQISVVSKDYQLKTHGEAVDWIEQTLNNAKIQHEPFRTDLTHNGRRLRHEVRLPQWQFEVGENDKHDPTIIMSNSYDRSRGLNLLFGIFRLVCSNGLVIGKKVVEINSIHLHEMIDFPQLADQLVAGIEEKLIPFRERMEKLMGMESRKFLREMLKTFPAGFLAMAQADLSEWYGFVTKTVGGLEVPQSIEEQRKPMTAYALYQVLTAVATHKVVSGMKRQKLDAQISKLMLG